MGATKISLADIELAAIVLTSVCKCQSIKEKTDDSFVGVNVERLRQLSGL